MRKLMNRKGFTLVEILVVILIIGILFVAFLPRIDFAGDKARETNVKTDLRTFVVAAEQLFKENAGLPDRDQDPAGSGFGNETVADDNIVQMNLLLDPSNKLEDSTDTHIVADDSSGVASALADPWDETYRVDIYSNYPTTNKQAILITSHGKDFVGGDDTADYGALIIYDKGHVSSCTFGLNQNIGSFSNIAAGTEVTAPFNISTFDIVNAKCGN